MSKLTEAEKEIINILVDRPYLTSENLARAIALAIRKADGKTGEDELFSDALSELNL
jgi:hypothetical protein